jgi:hypothetical protein
MRFFTAAAAGGSTARYLVNIAVTPNENGLPFNHTILDVASGLLWAVFALAVIGLIVSGAAMALGNHAGNYAIHDRAKTGAVWTVVGAIVAGASGTIVTWASSLQIH